MSLDFAETARLNEHDLELIDAYWRAANYLSVGQSAVGAKLALPTSAPKTAA